MKKEILTTERLVLRPFCEEDREEMTGILCNAEIKKTYMIPDFADPKEAEALFERLMKLSRMDDHFVYGIFFEHKLIGFLNDCEMKESTAEIGYVIAPEHQGKGFATEAVRCCIEALWSMGFAHIRAGFFEENIASGRVMQKCGMHKIGLEEDIEYKGVVHHCLYYEIDAPQPA